MLVLTRFLLSESVVTFKVWPRLQLSSPFCSDCRHFLFRLTQLDEKPSLREEGDETGMRGGGGGRGVNQWLHPLSPRLPPPPHPHLSFTLLLLQLAGFMRLISDNLAVTRHCTQPLLIFNEGSGSQLFELLMAAHFFFQWYLFVLRPPRRFQKLLCTKAFNAKLSEMNTLVYKSDVELWDKAE